LSDNLRTRRESLRQLEQIFSQHQQRVEELRAVRPHAEDPIELRGLRDELSASVARHERSLAQLSNVSAELSQAREAARREIDQDVESLISRELIPPTEDELQRLRAKVLQYSDLDPSVVTECEELEGRRERSRRDVADLRAASEQLLEIIGIADGQMHRRLHAAFSAVGNEFSRVFRIMLRGGDAQLEWLEADGVDIRARLPGRRMRSNSAFSGGERALIASSLLFGVLKIRPTPFCILDEVDAALDETNVDRFLEVLREIGAETQVIIVTHNRATMAAADALYGATINEEGVSSLLSMRLDAYDAAG
jgi:chromosome segregation protein